MMNITDAEGLDKSIQGDSYTSPGGAGQRLLQILTESKNL